MPLIGSIAARVREMGVEGDVLSQIELVYIIVEVGPHLTVVGKVGPVVRHRIIFKGQSVFGSVNVQRLIAGRHPIWVFVIPVAANIVRGLEMVIIKAKFFEAFCPCEA